MRNCNTGAKIITNKLYFNQEKALVGVFSVITNIRVDLLGCYIES